MFCRLGHPSEQLAPPEWFLLLARPFQTPILVTPAGQIVDCGMEEIECFRSDNRIPVIRRKAMYDPMPQRLGYRIMAQAPNHLTQHFITGLNTARRCSFTIENRRAV